MYLRFFCAAHIMKSGPCQDAARDHCRAGAQKIFDGYLNSPLLYDGISSDVKCLVRSVLSVGSDLMFIFIDCIVVLLECIPSPAVMSIESVHSQYVKSVTEFICKTDRQPILLLLNNILQIEVKDDRVFTGLLGTL